MWAEVQPWAPPLCRAAVEGHKRGLPKMGDGAQPNDQALVLHFLKVLLIDTTYVPQPPLGLSLGRAKPGSRFQCDAVNETISFSPPRF